MEWQGKSSGSEHLMCQSTCFNFMFKIRDEHEPENNEFGRFVATHEPRTISKTCKNESAHKTFLWFVLGGWWKLTPHPFSDTPVSSLADRHAHVQRPQARILEGKSDYSL